MTSGEAAGTATTDDVFLADAAAGPLHILQPVHGLRSGLDAIMLAAAAPVEPGERVLDAGAGAGVVGLAVARRCPGCSVTLLERSVELAALAQRNVGRNGMTERAIVVCADLTQPVASLRPLGLEPETFDHVLANPPFHDQGRVRNSPHALKAGASAFEDGDLDRWLRFLAAMAKPGGQMTLIHRADALGDVLQAIGARFGTVCVYPLFPRVGEPASRVLVQAIKGSRGPLRMLQGLVLHTGGDGTYTKLSGGILREGRALPLISDSP